MVRLNSPAFISKTYSGSLASDNTNTSDAASCAFSSLCCFLGGSNLLHLCAIDIAFGLLDILSALEREGIYPLVL